MTKQESGTDAIFHTQLKAHCVSFWSSAWFLPLADRQALSAKLFHLIIIFSTLLLLLLWGFHFEKEYEFITFLIFILIYYLYSIKFKNQACICLYLWANLFLGGGGSAGDWNQGLIALLHPWFQKVSLP
jgi:4-hydroxybenzoate polyprenyltransferase